MLKIINPHNNMQTLIRLKPESTRKDAEKIVKLIEKHTFMSLIIIDENNAD